MVEYGKLSLSAVTDAFCAANGEFAWRRADLAGVMRRLIERRLAILSGEVWVVEGTLFSPLSPHKDGGLTVFSWQVSDRQPEESWERFALRSLEETLKLIGDLDPEGCVELEAADKLYYHLCLADENAYSHQDYELTAPHTRPVAY